MVEVYLNAQSDNGTLTRGKPSCLGGWNYADGSAETRPWAFQVVEPVPGIHASI